MTDIVSNLVAMEIEEAIHNKIDGRRNWVIRVENNFNGTRKIVYSGGFGEAKRRGYMGEFLRVMAERKVRWYEFTYKADYKEALAQLNSIGIR